MKDFFFKPFISNDSLPSSLTAIVVVRAVDRRRWEIDTNDCGWYLDAVRCDKRGEERGATKAEAA